MRKAPDAFRTISEAADLLDTPAHVLRFWESKFPQVKPVKRAGGRRYYRRIDIDLLSGIKLLLHDQGMTIRGVQKLLAEKGPRHVAELAPFAEDVFDSLPEGAAEAELAAPAPALDADDTADDTALAQSVAVADIAPPTHEQQNAFTGMADVPVVRPRPVAPPAPQPVHAAQIAHLLRTHPPATLDQMRLAGVLAKLDRLVTRLSAQADRDRAR